MNRPTNWELLHPTIRHIAETTLTPKQLTAYRLHHNGISTHNIAILLRITRRAVRDRLAEADVKILAHPDYPTEDTT